jgi:hypothetical protein
MRKPRSGSGFTLTLIAKYLRSRTGYVRRLANACGVELIPIVPTRHGRGDLDTRPRHSAQRHYRLFSSTEAKRTLEAHHVRAGRRLA